MAVGGAAGYVLGAKAGRQRYQEITESARRFRQRPEVKRITEQVGNANSDTVLTQSGATCGSGPDASRANRPARPGRFGC